MLTDLLTGKQVSGVDTAEISFAKVSVVRYSSSLSKIFDGDLVGFAHAVAKYKPYENALYLSVHQCHSPCEAVQLLRLCSGPNVFYPIIRCAATCPSDSGEYGDAILSRRNGVSLCRWIDGGARPGSAVHHQH